MSHPRCRRCSPERRHTFVHLGASPPGWSNVTAAQSDEAARIYRLDVQLCEEGSLSIPRTLRRKAPALPSFSAKPNAEWNIPADSSKTISRSRSVEFAVYSRVDVTAGETASIAILESGRQVASSRAPVVARLRGDHAAEPGRRDHGPTELRTRPGRPVLCQLSRFEIFRPNNVRGAGHEGGSVLRWTGNAHPRG